MPRRLAVLLTLILASAALAIVTAATPAVAAPCDPPVANPVACENTLPGSPESEWGVSGAGSALDPGLRDRHERRPGPDDRLQGRHQRVVVPPRHLPDGLLRRRRRRRVATVTPDRAQQPTQLPHRCRDGPGRLRQLDPERVMGRAGHCSVGDLLREAGPHRRHRRREPRLLRGARRRRRVGHALPDLRHHVAGLQHLRRQQPLHRRTGRARLQGQLQPSVHHARQRAGGLGVQRRVPDGALPRVQRVRRQLQLRRRHRPPGRRAARAQGVHVASATTSTGRAPSAPTSRRPATPASTSRSSRGNEVFWKTRWENSIDGSGTPHRTLVSYKETHANAKIDPLANTWTGTWRDPRFSPPADGGRPENGLTGTMFAINCCAINMVVGQADGQMRFWRNTRVATLGTNATTTIGTNVIGYEWDEDPDNGFRPPGTFRVSQTTGTGDRLQDYGSTLRAGAGHPRHDDLPRAERGAGLQRRDDPVGLGARRQPRPRLGRARHGGPAGDGQPVRRHGRPAGHAASRAHRRDRLHRHDRARPTAITSPAAGATLPSARPSPSAAPPRTPAAGSAASRCRPTTAPRGGAPPAAGSWTYTFTPSATGALTLRARAVDDSANLGTAATTNVTVGTAPTTCPCTIWPGTATPERTDPDRDPVEVGVKFRSQHRRAHHRHPLLQAHRDQRHPRRVPVDQHRHPARPGQLHQRERQRVAAGHLRHAGPRHRRNDVRRLLLLPHPVRRQLALLRDAAAPRAAAHSAAGRRERRQRRLPLHLDAEHVP